MKKTLTQLHEERGYLVTRAREAMDEISANTDDSRVAELEARHDTIMAEFDQLEATIAREERTAQVELRLEQYRALNRPVQTGAAAAAGGEGEAVDYRTAFYSFLQSGADVGAISAEERAVLRAGFNAEMRAQTAGTGTAGGYTVPTTLHNEIVRVMKDWGPMLDGDVARVLVTGTGNRVTIPTIDDTAKGAGLHTEGGAVTDDGSEDVTLGQKLLDAFVYDTEWLKVSMELLADSAFNIEMVIADVLGERLARKGNNVLTLGTGSNQPQGIVTAAGAGVTTASATAIVPDELITFQHSVNAAYRRSPKCRWMFNDATLATIRKFKDGQSNYLWQMGDVRTGAPDTLLGKPYSINDDMASIATGTIPVIFGDFSRYWVRQVGAPTIGVVRERFFPDLGMLGLIRLDGELVDANAVKKLTMA